MRTFRCAPFLLLGLVFCHPWSPVAAQSKEDLVCRTPGLPASVASRLKAEYSSWRVHTGADLSPKARKDWEYKKYWKPSECPGFATGRFTNTQASYAFLLVPVDRPNTAYTLVVFSRSGRENAYQMTVIEKGDSANSRDVFIRSVKVRDFFDKRSQEQFKPEGAEGILIVESGEQQSGADVFFSTKNGYRREPVEY